VHQRRSVGAKLALDPVQPQRDLALPLGDRLAGLRTIDIFAGRIDRLRPALGALPVVWKARPPRYCASLICPHECRRARGSLRIDRSVTIFSPASSASGSSTSMLATSALSGRSRERRS
jgi:hypothetical protein